MQKHVRAVGVLYRVWGGIGMLLGAALLLLALAANVAAVTPATAGAELTARLTAVTLTAFGSVLLAGGAVNAWAGASLRPGHPAGRLVVLTLGLLNLFLLPFGTALGAYSFWVLLNEDARRLFEVPPA